MENELLVQLLPKTEALLESLDPEKEYTAIYGLEDSSFTGAYLKEKASKHVSHIVVPVEIKDEHELAEEILAKNMKGFFEQFPSGHPMKKDIIISMLQFDAIKNAHFSNEKHVNLQHLRTQFFLDHTETPSKNGVTSSPIIVSSPHTVFEWFKKYIQ